MKPFTLARFAVTAGLTMSSLSASAAIYQFQFLANPDALETTQDKSLDVLHTVTIDSSKIPSYNSGTLRSTAYWLNGGIQMTMSHQGKTVSLNDGLDPGSPNVVLPGVYHDEGFIDLGSHGPWFFALEFAPQNPFIDGHGLPYDPFVYGFLFAYQDNTAYKDFRSLWASGNTSVLASYMISSVPEPGTSGLVLAGGLIAGLAAARLKRRGV